MIGTFWNLCRACPAVPIDKFHSEYTSTYKWHDFAGPNQEHAVVRRAPQPQQIKETSSNMQTAKAAEDDTSEGPTMEPPMHRRKKYPDLAYKSNEFIPADAAGIDTLDSNVAIDSAREVAKLAPTTHLSKAITKISTEYRFQFGWPRRQHLQLTNGEAMAPASLQLRRDESVERGRPATAGAPAPVHRRRQQSTSLEHRRDNGTELEPLVCNDQVDGKPRATVAANRSRPFSAAQVLELRRELRRLADEYRLRDWGGGLDEVNIWRQVSRSHALDALSLARHPPAVQEGPAAPITKDRKDRENARKVTASMPPAGRPSTMPIRADPEQQLARARRDFLVRHHLERTTGVGDGALLPSPTREKLEPVQPRRREEPSSDGAKTSSPRSSPRSARSARSQSAGPAVGSERKSPKRRPLSQAPAHSSKEAKEDKGAAGGAGRRPRPSTAATTTAAASRRKGLKKPRDASSAGSMRTIRGSSSTRVGATATPTPAISCRPSLATQPSPNRPARQRTPAATSLPNGSVDPAAGTINAATSTSTTATTTTEQTSCSRSGRARSVAAVAGARTSSSSPAAQAAHAASRRPATAAGRGKPTSATAPTAEAKLTNGHHPPQQQQQQQQQQQADWLDDEPLIKSPPEPTRVKSPEQMIMRSPEPVNWTVPLDTGKTFTVTQNVLEDDLLTRAHSESRNWGPQSAPPELTGLGRHQQQRYTDLSEHKQQYQMLPKTPESESHSLPSFAATTITTSNGHHKDDSAANSPVANMAKDELTQEMFELTQQESKANKQQEKSTKPQTAQQAPSEAVHKERHSSDLLDKARNRFDKFWGKNPKH